MALEDAKGAKHSADVLLFKSIEAKIEEILNK